VGVPLAGATGATIATKESFPSVIASEIAVLEEAGDTVTLTVLLAGDQILSPLYCAVTTDVPAGSVLTLILAAPLALSDAVPRVMGGPKSVPLGIVKVTCPVGLATPLRPSFAPTLAVSVTLWPICEVAGDAVTEILTSAFTVCSRLV
jgi:hypothetical protein